MGIANLFGGGGAQGQQPGLQNPDRPFGVSLMAGIVGFFGGFYLIVLLLYIGLMNLVSSLFQALPTPGSLTSIDTPAVVLLTVYLTFMAVSCLALSRGLFLLQQWAYWFLIGLEALNIVGALVILITTQNGTLFFVNIWLPLVIVTYMLTLGSVRRAFRVPF